MFYLKILSHFIFNEIVSYIRKRGKGTWNYAVFQLESKPELCFTTKARDSYFSPNLNCSNSTNHESV